MYHGRFARGCGNPTSEASGAFFTIQNKSALNSGQPGYFKISPSPPGRLHTGSRVA